MEITLTLG